MFYNLTIHLCFYTIFCLWSEHQKKKLFSSLQKTRHIIASVSWNSSVSALCNLFCQW